MACSNQQSDLQSKQRPFLHFANRQFALLVRWRGRAPSPAIQEAFSRSLEKELTRTYRSPVITQNLARPYLGLSPKLFTQLARQAIDDAVVVEGGQNKLGQMTASIRIVGLAIQDIVHAFVFRPARVLKDPMEEAQRYAQDIIYRLSSTWTRPNRVPPMDPLLAANNLFARQACSHAVPLYKLALDGKKPSRTDLISEYTDAVRRKEICEERLQQNQAIRTDLDARFSLQFKNRDLAPYLVQTIEQAAVEAELAALLGKRTAKPVTLELSKTHFVVALRHEANTPGFPTVDRSEETPVVDFEPLQPLLDAMVATRAFAAERVGAADEAAMVKALMLEVRLQHLFGDSLRFVFAEFDGRAQLAPTLWLEHRDKKLTLPSRDQNALRQGRFVLGPEHDAEGMLTQDGLVVQFLELPPPQIEAEPTL